MSEGAIAGIDWAALPDEIVNEAKPIVEAGKYDDAVFAAFRLVEATIQERLHSKSVGSALVAEAFDATLPRIQIGSPADCRWVRELFGGSLGFIRNDRGHKKVPAVPCRSMRECFWYLSHGALLLHLLSRDAALFPNIINVSVSSDSRQGRIQLHGENLHRVTAVRAGGAEAPIVQRTADVVEAIIPSSFVGDVEVYADGELIGRRFCDARTKEAGYDGVYEVVDVNVPLLTDPAGRSQHSEYVGVILNVFQGGRYYRQVWPVRAGSHGKADFVRLAWDMGVHVPAAWYRDTETGGIHSAWSSAALAVLEKIRDEVRMSSLLALPRAASLEPGEVITLVARGVETIGTGRREIDLSREAIWQSKDSSIAYVDRAGILRAKQFGHTYIECVTRGFRSVTSVTVQYHRRGELTPYFEGVRPMSSMRFDANDDLYIVNQSERLHVVRRNGGVDVAFQLSKTDDGSHSMNDVAIDPSGDLYVTVPNPPRVMWFRKVGIGYAAGTPLGPKDDTIKAAIALANDAIIVGVMGAVPMSGHILKIRKDGTFSTFPTRDSAHQLALGPDGNIYVVTSSKQSVDIYDGEVNFVTSLTYGESGPVGGMAVASDGSVYVAMFNSGNLIRMSNSNEKTEIELIAENLGNLSSLAIDSRDRVFIGEVSTGRVTLVR